MGPRCALARPVVTSTTPLGRAIERHLVPHTQTDDTHQASTYTGFTAVVQARLALAQARHLTFSPPSPALQQAKTTKKVTIRLECKECKSKKQLVLKRCKHFELGEKKKGGGPSY